MKTRYTILIVEDHPADTELIQLQLEKVDLDIDLQTTATQAKIIHLLDNGSVDMVISDYNLEGLTGEDVLNMVRDRSQDVPFIMVTGYLGEKKAVEIMRSGASDYLTKDELDRLIPVVERELKNYQKRLQLKQERDSALLSLQERVKEQKCLYEIANIDEPDISIEEFLSRAVEFLPQGWQYPEITEALIEYDGNRYRTKNYRKTQWTLTAQNKTIKNGPLVVQVAYLEEKPDLDIGPFLTEERNLINSIVNHLSIRVNRILDLKELEHQQNLLARSNALAKFGHWELDLVKTSLHWSQEVKKIHEVSEDFTPSLDEAIHFYKKGKHRQKFQDVLSKPIEKGQSFDEELLIVTGKGNERWVRVIARPEFKEGKCIKVYGSFQDIDKQKRTELKLKEISEEHRRLAKVARETQNMVIIINLNRKIEWVNAAFEKKTGYSYQEVKGKNPKLLYGPATDPKTVSYIREKLKKYETFNVEILNYTKTGEPYWIQMSVSPSTDQHENVVGFFSIQEDITDRKDYVSQLKQKHERLEEAQRIGKIGDWDFNVETGEIFWSDQMYEIFDRDRDMPPPSYEELKAYFQEYWDYHDTRVKQAIEEARDYEFDINIKTERGIRKYIHAEGFTKLNEDGKVVKLHGIVQDITERKEKELGVLRREKQLRSITTNIDAVVFRYVLKPDGSDKMLFVSENLERLFEVPAELSMESTKYIWDLILDEDVQPLIDSIEESAETLNRWENRFRVKLPSGKVKWMQGYGQPTKLEGGAVRWDSMIIDVTKQVEQERINESLIQEVHHRVKNNLAIITGLLHLQLLELPEESRDRLPLERAITRIYSIAEVHKLLHEGSNLVDIEVSEYFNHLVDYIMDTINVDTDVEIDMHIETVQMNVNELTPLGMLMNELLTNSVKYAFKKGKKGKIKIQLSKIDGMYHVIYEDNGPGIKELQFEEAEISGLKLVKMLLEQMEAEYELDSEKGFGIEFTFKELRKGAHGNIGI